jgi:hypothetical protein
LELVFGRGKPTAALHPERKSNPVSDLQLDAGRWQQLFLAAAAAKGVDDS